jgi:hypothetical protein
VREHARLPARRVDVVDAMSWSGYLLAAAIGVSLSVAELVARYRAETGETWELARSRTAALYVLLNSGVAIGALAIARSLDWTFGLDRGIGLFVAEQSVVSAFIGMAFLRSAILVIPAGPVVIDIGPRVILPFSLGKKGHQLN